MTKTIADQFESHLENSNFPIWLEKIKKNSFKKFLSLKQPIPLNENWRYTNLKEMKYENFTNITMPEITLNSKNSKNSVFQKLSESFDEHSEVLKKRIQEFVSNASDKPAYYNISFFTDGIFLQPKDENSFFHASFEKKEKGNYSLLSIVEAKENSNFSYFEENLNQISESSFNSHSLNFTAKNNSKINYYSLEENTSKNYDISNKRIKLGNDTTGMINVGIFGGKIKRTVYDIVFLGQGANLKTLASYLAKDTEHIDLHTNSIHLNSNTSNDIVVKGVLDDKSTSIYRGLIKIAKEGQQTNSYLTNNTLLLSDKALMNSIPELMIDANDVKASHGATISNLDKEQLFYLESRGLPEKKAEKLIVEGFYYPVIDKIEQESVKEIYLEKWKKGLYA